MLVKSFVSTRAATDCIAREGFSLFDHSNWVPALPPFVIRINRILSKYF
jgi:hypothetical protein